ncbi:MAG: NADH-quinone oxidoreductase subunit A [Planctomycetota bacterium]
MYFDYANVFVFLAFGALFVVLNVSILSRFLRPTVKDAAKETTYECGETPVGSGWVRFDIRFYTVALVFLIFDVEVAFLYPWAVLFQGARQAGIAAAAADPAIAPWHFAAFLFSEMLVFVGILVVGFVYVWAKGDLSWIKASDIAAAKAGEKVRS